MIAPTSPPIAWERFWPFFWIGVGQGVSLCLASETHGLERLATQFAPIAAAVVVHGIWRGWETPALEPAQQGPFPFWPFVLGMGAGGLVGIDVVKRLELGLPSLFLVSVVAYVIAMGPPRHVQEGARP